jgi:acetyl-CoA carboxylase carboxyltransferase component
MAVMEGEAAVMAVHGPALDKAQRAGEAVPEDVSASVTAMRADYESQLDARYAAARGYVDAIVLPEETRSTLGHLLRVTSHFTGSHLGPFVLPAGAAGC